MNHNFGQNLDNLLDYTNNLINCLQETKQQSLHHISNTLKLQGVASPQIADYRMARHNVKIQNHEKQVSCLFNENVSPALEESDQKVIALAKAWNVKKEQFRHINNPFKSLSDKMNYVQSDLSYTCRQLFELDINKTVQQANAYLVRNTSIGLSMNNDISRDSRNGRSCSPGPEIRSIRANYGRKTQYAKPLRSLSPGMGLMNHGWSFRNDDSSPSIKIEVKPNKAVKSSKLSINIANPQQRSAQGSPYYNNENLQFDPEAAYGNRRMSRAEKSMQSPTKKIDFHDDNRQLKRQQSNYSHQPDLLSTPKSVSSQAKEFKKGRVNKHKSNKNESPDVPESIFIDLNQLISNENNNISSTYLENESSSKVSSAFNSFLESDTLKRPKPLKNKWILEKTPKTPVSKSNTRKKGQESSATTTTNNTILERKFSDVFLNDKSQSALPGKVAKPKTKDVFEFENDSRPLKTRELNINNCSPPRRSRTPGTPNRSKISNWCKERKSPPRARIDRSASVKEIRKPEKTNQQVSNNKDKRKAPVRRRGSPDVQEPKEKPREFQMPIQLTLVTSDKKITKKLEKKVEDIDPRKKERKQTIPAPKTYPKEPETPVVTHNLNSIDSLYADICNKLNQERANYHDKR